MNGPVSDELPFWKTKRLGDMTRAEWESLCDGCGRCCLLKLEDEDTGEIYATDVACRLLDEGTCRCTDYENRQAVIPSCVKLTPQRLDELSWLPPSCAYRRLQEGADLPWWHPLVSGTAESVHLAGMSVRGRTVREADVPEEDLEDRIVDWPLCLGPD
ncbi:YcgN family cysteine cluster protein [Lutibaculum baratangense]|uniref:UPF0260 protein N177_3911 n=1 Tax=Lutibaculum baratangense AMV1 TaxID=631454 RepID=V4RBI9_9HYPH|nr:YcgN family cysteine cluster protein [Lutibaculum baratangense]ESR22774.1 hypothetical protein N177_3911 [Lutibaculum baratangense AMV1]